MRPTVYAKGRDVPHAANAGRCYTCGASGPRRRIDTGQTIAYEGRLAVCESCVAAWAGLLGWLETAAAEKLQEKNRRLTTSNKELRERVAVADRLVEALGEYRAP